MRFLGSGLLLWALLHSYFVCMSEIKDNPLSINADNEVQM